MHATETLEALLMWGVENYVNLSASVIEVRLLNFLRVSLDGVAKTRRYR